MDHLQDREAVSRQILTAIDFYRSLVLDGCEAELSETKAWPFVRSRILKAFGDKGLTGQVLSILGAEALENKSERKNHG